MGPIIILDKSALQALSRSELVALHNCYSLNIVPILLIEILADLKKPSKRSMPSDKVMELANKVMPKDSEVNIHYRDARVASLLGRAIPPDGRPVVGGARPVKHADGKRGFIIEETPEEIALHRWRRGDFTPAEDALAERWRESAKALDLEAIRSHYKHVIPKTKDFNNLESLKSLVDEIFADKSNQRDLLKDSLLDFAVLPRDAQEIFLRWEMADQPLIRDFAPYAYHCFHINVCFNLALVHGLIGTRPTNRIDLEYLFYLPFCMVFSSGDRFHKQLCPPFLRTNQRFVDINDLKSDLSMIASGGLDNPEASNQAIRTDSVTAGIWDDLMARPLKRNRDIASNRPESEGVKFIKKELLEFMRKKIAGVQPVTESDPQVDWDSADFIIKKDTLEADDPCLCGSGLSFALCHGKDAFKH